MEITTREEWIEAAGGTSEAIRAENAALSIGRELLPPCALAVLADNGAEPAPEYWAWLAGGLSAQ